VEHPREEKIYITILKCNTFDCAKKLYCNCPPSPKYVRVYPVSKGMCIPSCCYSARMLHGFNNFLTLTKMGSEYKGLIKGKGQTSLLYTFF
jgi:hypothetical protein